MKIIAVLVFVLVCAPVNAEFFIDDPLWFEVSEQVGVDPLLLISIARVESKMSFDRGIVEPYPWTLNAKGYGGLRFDSRHAAEQALLDLREEGISNIDIGAMQINWHWNGKHFAKDPRELLDPMRNLFVGATILKRELGNAKTVGEAVGRYHSGNAKRAKRYSEKVMKEYMQVLFHYDEGLYVDNNVYPDSADMEVH